jgi:hypothetical protein
MKTTRNITVKDAIRFLSLLDPDLTNEAIQQRLEWLGLPECTTFVISHMRRSFRDDMRFLQRVGMLRNGEPIIPSRIRRLKPPEEEPFRYHYGRQSRED